MEPDKILVILRHSLFAKSNFHLGTSQTVEVLAKMPKVKVWKATEIKFVRQELCGNYWDLLITYCFLHGHLELRKV